MLRAYGVTDKGRIRLTNEDCFAIDERLKLCVVADGMGGHNAGEVAARMAVDTVVDFVAERRGDPRSALQDLAWPFGFDPSLSEAGNLLRTAIRLANVQIFEASATSDEYAGMGTTIVAALVDGDRLTVGHVGDSRLYLVANNHMRQLTHDDSWMAAVLAQDPGVDPVILLHHPLRSALTNVVGARPRVDVHVVEQILSVGNVLLLSTDGVHGALEDRCVERLLRDAGDVREIATTLVDVALARGSRDNCTAVVARHTQA